LHGSILQGYKPKGSNIIEKLRHTIERKYNRGTNSSSYSKLNGSIHIKNNSIDEIKKCSGRVTGMMMLTSHTLEGSSKKSGELANEDGD
jgi:hypothetical protein